MARLKESGDLEANADVVLLLYRPMDKEKSVPTGEDEIIIGKARDGPPGSVPVYHNERTLTSLIQPTSCKNKLKRRALQSTSPSGEESIQMEDESRSVANINAEKSVLGGILLDNNALLRQPSARKRYRLPRQKSKLE